MTPIELAAVASAAVPGLTPTACAPEPDDAADFDSAMLLDADRKRWRVRSPKHPEASARLETELLVLRAFAPGVRAELPFLMPTVAGTVRQGDLTTFVYSHLSGRPQSVEALAAVGPAVAREIGAAMAAIHDLPPDLVNNADLPSYTANEFRQRKLNELDQAATTGKIPAALLRRWEHALEDVALWRFSPCVVHGDLHEDNILVEGRRVTAVTGWTDLRIGDPADDFAWLVAVQDQKFVDTVQESYSAARKEAPDRHLLRRAALSAEFALAQWLVKGVAADNAQMIAEAQDMLRTLEQDIAAYGGQPISTEPPAPAVPAVPTVPAVAGAGPRVQAKTAVSVEPIAEERADAGPRSAEPDRNGSADVEAVSVKPIAVAGALKPAVTIEPISEDLPGEESPAEELPGDGPAGDEAAGVEAAGVEASGVEASADEPADVEPAEPAATPTTATESTAAAQTPAAASTN